LAPGINSLKLNMKRYGPPLTLASHHLRVDRNMLGLADTTG
jgi:hypothetical protein